MKHSRTLLTLLFVVTQPHAATVTPPWDGLTPAPTVTVADVQPPRWNIERNSSRIYTCTIAVHVRRPHPTRPNYTQKHYYSSTTPDANTCYGVTYRGNTNPVPYDEFVRAMETLRIPLNTGTTFPGYPDPNPIDRCDIEITVQYPGIKHLAFVSCTTTRPPVSCTLSTPDILQHEQQSVGTISSMADGTVRIACTGTTRITLTVPLATTALNSGDTQIPSTMSLGDANDNNVSTVADPYTTVNVRNTINSVSVVPGTYQGSGIVTASWD